MVCTISRVDLGFENGGPQEVSSVFYSSVKCGAQIGHSQAKNTVGGACAPCAPLDQHLHI